MNAVSDSLNCIISKSFNFSFYRSEIRGNIKMRVYLSGELSNSPKRISGFEIGKVDQIIPSNKMEIRISS